MRKLFAFLLALSLLVKASSQKLTAVYSEKQKLEVGAFGLKVLCEDDKFIYFFEQVEKESLGAFFSGKASNVNPKISVFNKKTLSFERERNYKKDVSDAIFFKVACVAGRIYFFDVDYNKKGKAVTISALEIDKNTLSPKYALKEITAFEFDDKIDMPLVSIQPSLDSAHFVISSFLNDDNLNVGVHLLDLDMKALKKTNIKLPGTKRNEFYLLNIDYTSKQNIRIFGEEFEEIVDDKKKKHFKLKSYTMVGYKGSGEKIYQVSNRREHDYVTRPVIKDIADGIALISGFYKNDISNTVEGIYETQVNIDNGKELSTSFIPFNNSQPAVSSSTSAVIANILSDGNFKIRDVSLTPDRQNFILLAERLNETNRGTNERTAGGSYRNVEITDISYGNLLVINASFAGVLNWAAMIPKKQDALVMAGSPNRRAGLWHEGDYKYGSHAGYYGSFTSQSGNDNLYIFFNDVAANRNVVSIPEQVKENKLFSNVVPFVLTCNYATGKISRTELSGNLENTIPLFPKSFTVGNTMYFPTREHTGPDLSRFEYKIGKVVFK